MKSRGRAEEIKVSLMPITSNDCHMPWYVVVMNAKKQ